MRNLIKMTWKHFTVAFIVQILITLFVTYFHENMYIAGQMLLALVTWFVLNIGFEIYQKNRLNGKDTITEILFDSLAAGLGGLLAVLIGNLFV